MSQDVSVAYDPISYAARVSHPVGAYFLTDSWMTTVHAIGVRRQHQSLRVVEGIVVGDVAIPALVPVACAAAHDAARAFMQHLLDHLYDRSGKVDNIRFDLLPMHLLLDSWHFPTGTRDPDLSYQYIIPSAYITAYGVYTFHATPERSVLSLECMTATDRVRILLRRD